MSDVSIQRRSTKFRVQPLGCRSVPALATQGKAFTGVARKVASLETGFTELTRFITHLLILNPENLVHPVYFGLFGQSRFTLN
jgi:hypothetical protein